MVVTSTTGKIQFAIYLDKKVVEKIDELAALMGWSRSRMGTELILASLEENEQAIRLGSKLARGVKQSKETIAQLREMLTRGQLDLFDTGAS